MNSGRFQKNNTVGKNSWFRTGHKIWVGKKHTEESRNKIRIGRLGKKYPRNKKRTPKVKEFLIAKFISYFPHQKRNEFVQRTPKRKIDPARTREYRRKQKEFVFEQMGNCCVRCSFSDIRALQIDHINGGGSKERRERTFVGTYYRNVLRSVLNNEGKYQLLCANCNWIKRFENNEIKK